MEPTKINNLLEEWSNHGWVYIFSQTVFFKHLITEGVIWISDLQKKNLNLKNTLKKSDKVANKLTKLFTVIYHKINNCTHLW